MRTVWNSDQALGKAYVLLSTKTLRLCTQSLGKSWFLFRSGSICVLLLLVSIHLIWFWRVLFCLPSYLWWVLCWLLWAIRLRSYIYVYGLHFKSLFHTLKPRWDGCFRYLDLKEVACTSMPGVLSSKSVLLWLCVFFHKHWYTVAAAAWRNCPKHA